MNLQDIVLTEVLDRKIIEYKTRTISELIYEDELVKNITTGACYEITNTITNNIYILINIYLENIINMNCVPISVVIVLFILENDLYFQNLCQKNQ